MTRTHRDGTHDPATLSDDDLGAAVGFSDPLHHDVHQFLVREAVLLDEQRYGEWLTLMTEDLVYRMPVRATTAGDVMTSILPDMDHFCDDHYSLGKRVERLATEYAWTEDPPSRVRHFVTNVRSFRTDRDDELRARSSFLLFRSRGDLREAEFVAGQRTDLLRRVDDEWRLARRDILVDESVLRTQNLAIFL